MNQREHDKKWKTIQKEYKIADQATNILYELNYISSYKYRSLHRKIYKKRYLALLKLSKNKL